MEVEDQRTGRGGPLRAIEPAAQPQAIVRGEAGQLGPDEGAEIGAGVWAVGDLTQRTATAIEHPDILRGVRAADGEGEVATVAREVQPAHDLARQCGADRQRAAGGIVEGEFAAPGGIPEEGDRAAILAEGQFIEFRVIALGEDRERAGLPGVIEGDLDEGEEVAVAVGDQVEGAGVGAEAGVGEGAGAAVRRQQRLAVGLEVEQIEVVVAATEQARFDRQPTVAAEVQQRRAPGGRAEESPLAGHRIEQIRVEGRAVAPVRADAQRGSIAGPPGEGVGGGAAIGEAAQGGAVGFHDVDLLVHPATGCGAEGEPVAGRGPRDAADLFIERRDECGEAAADGDRPDLRGAGEVCDEREPVAAGREAGIAATADPRQPSDG